MSPEVKEAVGKLVANRKQFFALVDALEKKIGYEVDTIELETAIDSDHAGKDSVTEREANAILRASKLSKLRAVA